MDVQAKRVTDFRQLHSAGCFVMPNPWDVGSARALDGSASRPWPRRVRDLPGPSVVADTQVTRDQALDHFRLSPRP